MTLSGIPGVTADAPKYVQKALLPDRTDAEAVAELTRSVVTAAVNIIITFVVIIVIIIIAVTFTRCEVSGVN